MLSGAATASTTTYPPLRQTAAQRGILMGAAVNANALSKDPQYGQVLSANYNALTAENVMKFAATEPSLGHYDFSQADALVSFAAANHMQVRGHNLVWGQYLPAWLTQGTWTRDQLIQIMHDHISNVVTHFATKYPGVVTQWDVVNEAIDGNGNLVSNLWEQVIGSQYLSLAFQFAHEADPSAKLYYNDFGGEGLGTKSNAVYWDVSYLKSLGVPIDGVGLEMHTNISSPPQSDIATNMARLASQGFKVAVTEMDNGLQPPPGQASPTSSQWWAQAQLYHDTLATCLAQPACTTFVTWGFTDKYSWIPGFLAGYGWALPFTDQYVQKPAYIGLSVALQGQ
jgi:endo-1,4-beta-xylanase